MMNATMKDHKTSHVLRLCNILLVLLAWPACLSTDVAHQGELWNELQNTHETLVLNQDGEQSWKSYEKIAATHWENRSERASLVKSLVSYEQANLLLEGASELSKLEREQHAARILLKLSHGYYLLGYMSAPVAQRMDGAREAQQDAITACDSGRSYARDVLSLFYSQRSVDDLLSKPTNRKLESIKERSAQQALYYYALNTQCEMELVRGRFMWRNHGLVYSMFEEVMLRQPGYGYGLVYGALGAYHARHGQGGSDREQSRKRFEEALELGPNNFMIHVMFAESYAVRTQNSLLFDRHIQTVFDVPLDLVPEIREENKIARARARQLVEAREKLFF